jgi:hypothetical protein
MSPEQLRDPLTARARALELAELEARNELRRLGGEAPLPQGSQLGWIMPGALERYTPVRRTEIQRRVTLGSVSSPLAAQVLHAAYAEANRHNFKIPFVRGESNYLNLVDRATDDAFIYQGWVRERLAASGLAQRLPDGRAGLPDIYERLPEPRRALERLFAPRNHKQLVRHLVHHLDWYLDSTQPVRLPVKLLAYVIGVPVCGALMVGLVKLHMGSMLWMLAKWIPAAFLLLLGRTWGRRRIGDATVTNFYQHRELINAAELYYYLAEAYAEPSEPHQA